MPDASLPSRGWLQRDAQFYVFGLVAVLAATSLRLLAQPIFGPSTPYVVYILPIMAAAAYGGLAPGLFASIASSFAILFVFLGGQIHSRMDVAYLCLFLVDGLYISWLGEQMRTAIRRADHASTEAEAARERESRILNSISDSFGSLDAEWKFTHANARLGVLTGLEQPHLLGRSLWDVWPELNGSAARRELERAMRNRVSVRSEWHSAAADRWYEISTYPQAAGLSLFIHEITERKRAERILRDSEERLRLAPEAARMGIWTLQLPDRRVSWSPEIERILGLAPGSLAQTFDAALAYVHPEDRVRVSEVITRALSQPGDFEVEFRFQHTSGETRWMLGRGKLYPGATGEPARLAGISMDITAQKHNEEKLRHTQKLESLGILAGGIAHDFNNLLVGIIGNASLAAETAPVDSTARALLQEVLLAGEKAAHLTRQMLAYSGKGRFVIEPLEISSITRETQQLVHSSIPRNVDLRLDLKSDLPCVEADSGQIQQVVMNLIINAAEAIPAGRNGIVLVRTSLQSLDQQRVQAEFAGQDLAPGNYVVLEVHDTGVGMDDATRARIFEPFFTTKFVGRGLGLSAVMGIVRGHKGALTVSSSLGKGTSFRVYLPATASHRPQSRGARPESSLKGEGCVLIVDDECAVRKLAQAALRNYGYTALGAEDGHTALDTLRRNRPVDLVVLDLSMPGMTAHETIDRIRVGWPATRILLSSGYDEDEVLSRFENGSVAGFVQKPYTPAQLAGKVKLALAVLETAGSSD
ncbi:MAG: PAS domain S-box protein [Bryobacteraceae bacterium]